MCSIFKYKNCMGRNFDYEVSYGEEVRKIQRKEFYNPYAVMGVCAGMVKDYPLIYDGINEYGLCAGALAFEGNAVYKEACGGYGEIPAYDFVFTILSCYKNVQEVKDALDFTIITNEQYSNDIPNSDLHWFVCDKNESIIIEQKKDGLNWYDGDVMTNNPPYNLQKETYENSKDVVGINTKLPEDDQYYSRGSETIGLDGDYTSEGRFFRLSWLKKKLEQSENNFNDIGQSFHLLSSVEQIYGVTLVGNKFEYTIYSVVYDMENCLVYLKKYDDECKRELKEVLFNLRK